MKITRFIAAPVAVAAIVVGSTVGITGVAAAEPAPPAMPELNLEAFADQLGTYTTIGGFAGTAVGAGIGCLLLGTAGGTVTPIAGSIAGCTAGAGIGGLIGTILGGSFAIPELFTPVAP